MFKSRTKEAVLDTKRINRVALRSKSPASNNGVNDTRSSSTLKLKFRARPGPKAHHVTNDGLNVRF